LLREPPIGLDASGRHKAGALEGTGLDRLSEGEEFEAAQPGLSSRRAAYEMSSHSTAEPDGTSRDANQCRFFSERLEEQPGRHLLPRLQADPWARRLHLGHMQNAGGDVLHETRRQWSIAMACDGEDVSGCQPHKGLCDRAVIALY